MGGTEYDLYWVVRALTLNSLEMECNWKFQMTFFFCSTMKQAAKQGHLVSKMTKSWNRSNLWCLWHSSLSKTPHPEQVIKLFLNARWINLAYLCILESKTQCRPQHWKFWCCQVMEHSYHRSHLELKKVQSVARKELGWPCCCWCDGSSTLAPGKGSWGCLIHYRSLLYFGFITVLWAMYLVVPGEKAMYKNFSIRNPVWCFVCLVNLTWAGWELSGLLLQLWMQSR